MDPPDFQPEIKFRWCRTVRCRAQGVTLVLTSVTGTQVNLVWKADLGWYESKPFPVPCGLHTGFILIRDKALDAVSGRLKPRERDYKVDPFHIAPHKFAVELFLESDETSPFWSDAPELRLRYLSSDHLERLGAQEEESFFRDEEGGGLRERGFHARKWVSSTALDSSRGLRRGESRDASKKGFAPADEARPGEEALSLGRAGSLARGRSQGQLCPALASFGSLREQGLSGASTSSPNLSRAFQVAVDLSRASSKFLAGLSSTSSGVCLGYEDGSDPPSPDNKDSAHADSPYAAGGETSQDSEAEGHARRRGEGDGEGARRKRFLYGSSERGRSLHLEDLQDTWAAKRQRESLGHTDSSTSFEDILSSVSVARRDSAKTELNLLKFDTLAQERLVHEILEPSDSDFEDEEAACENSASDLRERYGCVITFESRSTSMDDVGSPRALEDALVSLTSNESHSEFKLEATPPLPQPQPRRTKLAHADSAEESSKYGDDEVKGKMEEEEEEVDIILAEAGGPSTVTPVSKPRTMSPTSSEEPKTMAKSEQVATRRVFVTKEEEKRETSEEEEKRLPPLTEKVLHPTKDQIYRTKQRTQELSLESRPRRARSPDMEYDDEDFQYDSLKHEDEHLPIDIRNIDSEESLLSSRLGGRPADDDEDEDEAESGRTGSYDFRGAFATYSSIEGEIPTDSMTLLQPGSQKATVREAEEFVRRRRTDGGRDDDDDHGESEYDDRRQIDEDKTAEVGGKVYIRCSSVSKGAASAKESIKKEEREQRTPRGAEAEVKRARVTEGQEEGNEVISTSQDRAERQLSEPAEEEKSSRRLSIVKAVRDAGRPQEEDRREGDDAENRRPRIVRLHHTGTQTTRKVSQATSTDDYKRPPRERSALPRSTPKYSRSPLRNRTINGQVETPYTPLPDRFSGPWSQRLPGTPGAPTAAPPPAMYPSAFSPSLATHGKHDLATLQRNLYNLVERDSRRSNSAYLAELQARKYHLQQSSSHQDSYQTPDHSYRYLHQGPQPQYTSTPQIHAPFSRQAPQSSIYSSSSSSSYLYPMLSSSGLKPSSSTFSPSRLPGQQTPSSRTFEQSETRKRPGGVTFGGSVNDLTKLKQTSKHFYETYTSHGVKGSSSLPDLRPTSARARLYAHDPGPSTSGGYASCGPRHAHSELDLMMGGGRGRVRWLGEDSDSGDSTDSLIDEAFHATSTPLDLSADAEYFRPRRRRRSKRRRSRSHQGVFTTLREGRDERDGRDGHGTGGRPYLPYRHDQISPGQQVKVLAPGGGVALARVLTNQRTSLTSLVKRDSWLSSSASQPQPLPASVTVVLLSEPNRLQGSIVTVPLEKVLLAWPSN